MKQAITNFDGQRSFHDMGEQAERPTTVALATAAAGIGFSVQSTPLMIQNGEETKIVDGQVGIIRTDTMEAVGFVGKKYTPIQNGEAFEILTPSLEQGLIEIGRAGFFRGGSSCFMQADVKGVTTEILPGDAVHSRILVVNSHDGTRRMVVKSTPIRVICQNTLIAAVKGAGSEIKISHKLGAQEQVQKAGQIIAMALKNHEQACEAFSAMAHTSMTGEQITAFFRDVLGGRGLKDQPSKEGEDLARDFQRTLDNLQEIMETSPVKAKEGTLWGAYNALTEWVDHRRTATPASRLQNALDGGTFYTHKQVAFREAVALMK